MGALIEAPPQRQACQLRLGQAVQQHKPDCMTFSQCSMQFSGAREDRLLANVSMTTKSLPMMLHLGNIKNESSRHDLFL